MIKKSNIPNLLTGARVLAVPLALVIILTQGSMALLLALFLFAAATDFLDGYLARKWHSTSALGALVDPVADKLLVTLILLYLLSQHAAPLTPIAVILLREIYISALREFLSTRGERLPVSKGGKWKTALQMLSITGLLTALTWDEDELWNAGLFLLWASAVLTLTSAINYTRAAWPTLTVTKH